MMKSLAHLSFGISSFVMQISKLIPISEQPLLLYKTVKVGNRALSLPREFTIQNLFMSTGFQLSGEKI
jgi:hypothetical protein